MLAEQGFTFRPAKRGTKDDLPEIVNIGKKGHRWIDLALERAMTKVHSGAYGTDTAILVYVDTYSPLPMEFRAELVARTEEQLANEKHKVYGVYYLHSHNRVRTIDEVRLRTS